MKHLARIPSLMREYLFPSGCALCGRMLLDQEEAWYGLCTVCRNRFTITIKGEERCSLCGRPLISELDRCLQCRNGEAPYFDQLVSIFPYTGDYRKLLGAYKFGRHKALGNFFLEKILESCFFTPVPVNPVLVPVPPRPGKIKKTGWDQIEYLAKLLKKAYRKNKCPRASTDTAGGEYPSQFQYLPVYRCLQRLPSKTQKELNKENRKSNLLGRIRCTRKVPREVILFDDVITTGSTLDACAAALKEGGAEKVYGVCLFYS